MELARLPQPEDETRHVPRRARSAPDSLVSRFAEGDPEAIASVSSLIGKVVQCRGYYVPRDERPDVIQDAMVDVFRALKEHSCGDDASCYALIRVITHRRCIDWLRRRKKTEQIASEARDNTAKTLPPPAQERWRLGAQVISKLRRSCQDLLALHAGLGLSYVQISGMLGRTPGALRTQAYECLKAARRILRHARRRQSFAVRNGRGT